MRQVIYCVKILFSKYTTACLLKIIINIYLAYMTRGSVATAATGRACVSRAAQKTRKYNGSSSTTWDFYVIG